MEWEKSKNDTEHRAKVWGGWVLKCFDRVSVLGGLSEWHAKVIFISDPSHEWKWAEWNPHE